MRPRKRTRQKAGDKRAGEAPPQPQESPALMPREFALCVMHDEALPMALRVSAAKLAASLLPRRASDAPAVEDKPGTQREMQAQSQTWSDFELARRILHILHHTDRMLEEQEALGDAVPERDRINPVEKADYQRLRNLSFAKTT
jgi:hypothetical protein